MFSSQNSQVSNAANYIEDVFSTYLYTGNDTSQAITNNIDLSTKGGMVWIKNRGAAVNHALYDTSRGPKNVLRTNNNLAQSTDITGYNFNSFLSSGFSLDPDNGATTVNSSGNNYVSWSFREQAKFFDIVTYTGTGSTSTEIAHSLGSVPGMVVCKKISATSDWAVWHRGSGGNTDVTGFQLNSTAAAQNNPAGYSTLFTSTTFRPSFVGSTNDNSNNSGETYVAYLFAHNAGGFGLTGTDNVISCGSFTTDGSGAASVTLGYEPQWILTKRSSGTSDWEMLDTMRSWSNTNFKDLFANSTSGENNTNGSYFVPNATGFQTITNGFLYPSSTYIYIAIRRGPMKVPTDATKVLALSTWTGSTGNKDLGSQTANFGTGFATFIKGRNYGQDWGQFDQLRGVRPFLSSDLTSAEINDGSSTGGISVVAGNQLQLNSGSYFGGGGDGTGYNYIGYNFRRAPSFFDEVCYTGTGSNTTVTHNLGVVPELIIVKNRGGGQGSQGWISWNAGLPSRLNLLRLDTTAATYTEASARLNVNALPTATQFEVGTDGEVNGSGGTYVAYLFATCAGVSKVGSYTGTGTTLQVNCGFTAGARFVLIKRTDSTGGWYVWDTARGIVSGNDPYLLLNSTAAEVTSTDYIDTYSAGFEISSTAPAAINASGGTFIYLAIA